jgi:anti-sigma B factor antagonist
LADLAVPTHLRDLADPDGALVTHSIDRLGVALAVQGELDLASAPRLARRIKDALCMPVARVTVELSGVEFIDSQGLHVLNDARLAARERGVALVLASPSRCVLRLLEVTSMIDLFEVRVR